MSSEVRSPLRITRGGINLQSFDEMWKLADAIVKAGIRSSTIKNAYQALCVIQYGFEVGLGPMSSIKCITFKGEVPTIDGDAAKALILQSGYCRYIKTWTEGKGNSLVGYCETLRQDDETPYQTKFTWDDAVRAKLTSRDAWVKYPERMVQYRALGYAARDMYPDVLQGLHITQEIEEDTIPAPTCETPRRADRVSPPDTSALGYEQGTEAEATDAIAAEEELVHSVPEPDKEGRKESDGAGNSTTSPKKQTADENTIRTMLIGLYKEFLNVYKDIEDSPEGKRMFTLYCAEKLACPLEDVNHYRKFTLQMIQKMKSILEAEKKLYV